MCNSVGGGGGWPRRKKRWPAYLPRHSRPAAVGVVALVGGGVCPLLRHSLFATEQSECARHCFNGKDVQATAFLTHCFASNVHTRLARQSFAGNTLQLSAPAASCVCTNAKPTNNIIEVAPCTCLAGRLYETTECCVQGRLYNVMSYSTDHGSDGTGAFKPTRADVLSRTSKILGKYIPHACTSFSTMSGQERRME